ncbi:MAG: alpha/beta hydrolase, partial [Bacteroidota bacterium]
IVMGHSLGGFLSLYMALNSKEVAKLIVVDGLAYMGAAQDPNATPESMKTISENMRDGIQSQSPEEFEKSQPKILETMISSSDKIKIAMDWGRKSDAKIVSQAMYELFQWDLREEVSDIKIPTLILGSWAGYKDYGVTKEMVEKNFYQQFAKINNKQILLSETSKHFIMWDDEDFLMRSINRFLD